MVHNGLFEAHKIVKDTDIIGRPRLFAVFSDGKCVINVYYVMIGSVKIFAQRKHLHMELHSVVDVVNLQFCIRIVVYQQHMCFRLVRIQRKNLLAFLYRKLLQNVHIRKHPL